MTAEVDGLSTSARLAKAEQERDEALHDLAHATFQLDTERTRVAHWREQNDLARDEGVRLNVALLRAERERDDAVRRAADLEQIREELASAKTLNDGYAEDLQQADSEAADHLHERLRLKAELAGARQEIERLKAEAVTSADNYLLVAAELSSARQQIRQAQAAAEALTCTGSTFPPTIEEH